MVKETLTPAVNTITSTITSAGGSFRSFSPGLSKSPEVFSKSTVSVSKIPSPLFTHLVEPSPLKTARVSSCPTVGNFSNIPAGGVVAAITNLSNTQRVGFPEIETYSQSKVTRVPARLTAQAGIPERLREDFTEKSKAYYCLVTTGNSESMYNFVKPNERTTKSTQTAAFLEAPVYILPRSKITEIISTDKRIGFPVKQPVRISFVPRRAGEGLAVTRKNQLVARDKASVTIAAPISHEASTKPSVIPKVTIEPIIPAVKIEVPGNALPEEKTSVISERLPLKVKQSAIKPEISSQVPRLQAGEINAVKKETIFTQPKLKLLRQEAKLTKSTHALEVKRAIELARIFLAAKATATQTEQATKIRLSILPDIRGAGRIPAAIQLEQDEEDPGVFVKDEKAQAARESALDKAIKETSFKDPFTENVYANGWLIRSRMPGGGDLASEIVKHRNDQYPDGGLFDILEAIGRIGTVHAETARILGIGFIKKFKAVRFAKHGERVGREDVLRVLERRFKTTSGQLLDILGGVVELGKEAITEKTYQQTIKLFESRTP